jgi:hypothetical protein
MESRRPPSVCPACGDKREPSAVEGACVACRYVTEPSGWTSVEDVEARRRALVDGVTGAIFSALFAFPTVVLARYWGGPPSRWIAQVLMLLILGSLCVLFAVGATTTLRGAGRRFRWSYRSADGAVTAQSTLDPNGAFSSLSGGRTTRELYTPLEAWSALACDDAHADALARWLDEREPPPPPDELSVLSARAALAIVRLASKGALQLVLERRTTWSRAAQGLASRWSATIPSLGSALVLTADEPALERALLASVARASTSDGPATPATPEAMHYRALSLGDGARRAVQTFAVLREVLLTRPELLAPPAPAPQRSEQVDRSVFDRCVADRAVALALLAECTIAIEEYGDAYGDDEEYDGDR